MFAIQSECIQNIIFIFHMQKSLLAKNFLFSLAFSCIHILHYGSNFCPQQFLFIYFNFFAVLHVRPVEREKKYETLTFISFIMTQPTFMVFTTSQTDVLFYMHSKISIHKFILKLLLLLVYSYFESVLLLLLLFAVFLFGSIENSNSVLHILRALFVVFFYFSSASWFLFH